MLFLLSHQVALAAVGTPSCVACGARFVPEQPLLATIWNEVTTNFEYLLKISFKLGCAVD
jgi:hypothetical protein